MGCSPPGSSVHGVSPGKNTGVGCYALLQGIFLTQGSNLHLLRLLHWQMVSLPPHHLGSPWKETLILLTYINSSHKQQELQKTYLKSNLTMTMYANSLKLQIEYPVVFLLTFNSSSLGISKIISQRWLKELSFSWSGLSLLFPHLSGTCTLP